MESSKRFSSDSEILSVKEFFESYKDHISTTTNTLSQVEGKTQGQMIKSWKVEKYFEIIWGSPILGESSPHI